MSYPRPKMILMSDVSVETVELRRLQRRVERLFSVLEEALEIEASETLNAFCPKIDLRETNNAVIVSAELPGVRLEDVDLTVTSKGICIEGEKRYPGNTQKAISHFCCERQYGKFKRRISLRWAININETSAEIKNGTLFICLPKLTDRRGKSVKVPIANSE